MLDLQLTRLRMSAGGRPGWSNLSTILNRMHDYYDDGGGDHNLNICRPGQSNLTTMQRNFLIRFQDLIINHLQKDFPIELRRLCFLFGDWSPGVRDRWGNLAKWPQTEIFTSDFFGFEICVLNLVWSYDSWLEFNLVEWPLTKYSDQIFL